MKILTTTWVALMTLVGMAQAEVSNVSAKEAAKRLKKDPKIVVVDIRTPEEFAEGHLNGAINIDMRSEDFEEKLAKLDRDGTYLMHCLSGGRSTASVPLWKELGFEKVMHLEKGIAGWKQNDLPLVVPKDEGPEKKEKAEE